MGSAASRPRRGIPCSVVGPLGFARSRPLTLREGDICKTSRTDSRSQDLRGVLRCPAVPDGGSVCWSAGFRRDEGERRALLILDGGYAFVEAAVFAGMRLKGVLC